MAAPVPGADDYPKMPRPHLLWLRRDLRLADNPALAEAAESGAPVIPVFVVDPAENLGGAARWWRGRSLQALDTDLKTIGGRLILRQGAPLDAIMALLAETRATHLHFNQRFEPADLRLDAGIVTAAREAGTEVQEHPGNRLHEPWALKTLKGDPFRVFTPFWRRLAESYRSPAAASCPKHLTAPTTWPESAPLKSVFHEKSWAAGFAADWQPGEQGARAKFREFVAKVAAYPDARDLPATEGTSRLSPHLAWGEISVHAIWRHLSDRGDAAKSFLRELGWRDFNTHLLYHFPELPELSWNAQFRDFPWETAPEHLRAWQEGRTGYPIVDAGMRQLWRTGWMHNRVRMIVASFLIKDLLIDWRKGEAWFWDTLVDADLPQNAGNWQWAAGSGADAAPYFRVLNPTTQSMKFDPKGDYIRRFVPELAKLAAPHIHAPEQAPVDVLKAAGIRLGQDYPRPIVDHAKARHKALAIYKSGRPPRQGDLF